MWAISAYWPSIALTTKGSYIPLATTNSRYHEHYDDKSIIHYQFDSETQRMLRISCLIPMHKSINISGKFGCAMAIRTSNNKYRCYLYYHPKSRCLNTKWFEIVLLIIDGKQNTSEEFLYDWVRKSIFIHTEHIISDQIRVMPYSIKAAKSISILELVTKPCHQLLSSCC